MPLLMMDLDETLIDRSTAFRSWVDEFVRAQRGGDSPDDVAWMLDADGDGQAPRDQVAARVRERFGLTESEFEPQDLRNGTLSGVRPDPAVDACLRLAKERGWKLIVVTNGQVRQQEAKLQLTGLDKLVDGWVVSEAVHVNKPEPEIYFAAAVEAGVTLDGAGMIGDSVDDIRGAARLHLDSAWIRRSREWTETEFFPTLTVDTVIDAIDAIV